ncbi:hypothetical protein J4E86_008978 [Alternaria arbusti]|uniref:uncharacterized protein n=1 Tax=Alternaria arbusti TaxID=232088 RepID=UPI00221EF9FC|nr:uncharacterized protein J4E86_008978 [Alternaria arbusti]KAI4946274.1 hypothetical protein J4E86_008978 [Alternaria arbusti]
MGAADSGRDGNDPAPLYHQQRIHFTVRLFLAKSRQEVTKRTCLVTAGSTRPTHPDDANQRSVTWVLEKTGKNERGKGGDKGQKKNERKTAKKGEGKSEKKGEEKKGEEKNEKKGEAKNEKKSEAKKKNDSNDILTIVEDETTEWENDVIFEWTKKAQKLVKREANNIFRKGVETHGMTVGHLVRGLKNSSKLPNLTVEQLISKNKTLTVEKARDIIIDQAWEWSLEHFLRKNKNQGTCEAADKVHYTPPKTVVVGSDPTNEMKGEGDHSTYPET